MMPILLNKYNNRGDYHVVQSYYARNTNIAYYDLLLGGDLIYINKERLSNNPKNQPPWLGGIKLSRSFINSIPNETDLDNLRKKHNYQYYQSAWHGSPHDFDTFDLGAIGTGEGNQAHGWGLYFAKDKKVSKLYKEVLSKEQGSNKSSLFKVEIPNETELLVSIPQVVGAVATGYDALDYSNEDMYRFNTASGKYFHSIVFPSLRSETRDMRTSSSLRSSATSHPSSHTASARCCCNFRY